jgi:hypothetical protein
MAFVWPLRSFHAAQKPCQFIYTASSKISTNIEKNPVEHIAKVAATCGGAVAYGASTAIVSKAADSGCQLVVRASTGSALDLRLRKRP